MNNKYVRAFLSCMQGRSHGGSRGCSGTPWIFFDIMLIFGKKKHRFFPKVILNALGPSKCVSNNTVQFFLHPVIFGPDSVHVCMYQNFPRIMCFSLVIHLQMHSLYENTSSGQASLVNMFLEY